MKSLNKIRKKRYIKKSLKQKKTYLYVSLLNSKSNIKRY